MRRTGRRRRKAKFTLFEEKWVIMPRPGKEVGEMINTQLFRRTFRFSLASPRPFWTFCIKGIILKLSCRYLYELVRGSLRIEWITDLQQYGLSYLDEYSKLHLALLEVSLLVTPDPWSIKVNINELRLAALSPIVPYTLLILHSSTGALHRTSTVMSD